MTTEKSQGLTEPVLHRDAAKIMLLMTGRAVEVGGCLLPTEVKPDTIGRAGFEIYRGNEQGTLSEVIEEITGCPPTAGPEIIREIVAWAVLEHAVQLGMPAEEAAQIAV